MDITATRMTHNPAWTKTLTLKLVRTSNGYWWHATGTTEDAVTDANALRPGQTRRTGYATVESACRQAIKDGWLVVRD